MSTISLFKNKLLLLPLILTILVSCGKVDSQNVTGQEASLKVSLEGLDFDSETELQAGTKQLDNQEGATHIQYADGDFRIESQLITENTTKNINLSNGNKQNSQAALKELGDKIRYRLLVYAENGNLVEARNYIYGSESEENAIELQTNVNYTFVVVSSRSVTSTPPITNENQLKDAMIQNVNADLLYWSKKMKLNVGLNFLAAKLKPQFSEITTTLRMDENMTGTITSIGSPVFKPVVNALSLKLENGALTYGTVNTSGKTVNFPALGNNGLRTVTASPTTLIHNTTAQATLNFGSLQIDGETKSNITISGLSIKPGHRYNLILTLKTCTKEVTGNSGLNWSYPAVTRRGRTGIEINGVFYANGSKIERVYTEKGADYGFVIDLYQLDNSFNFEVNGNRMATREIQFQSDAQTSQNIEFEDGSQYQGANVEGGSVPAIWTIRGSAATPMVKVVISRTGEVTIFGSKKSNGKLYPLRLKQGTTFNTFPWSPGSSQNNIVKFTSIVDGETIIKGSGSGRIKIPCAQ